IEILPESFEKVYFNWMENIRDWCISRQLWWGHRIPVWYCENGHTVVEVEDPPACPQCGAALTQDEDVLDTWFSSGLWTHSTLGLVEQYGADALRFTLVTGSSPGNDMKLQTSDLENARNFANKLWNTARFVLRYLDPALTRVAVTWSDPSEPPLPILGEGENR